MITSWVNEHNFKNSIFISFKCYMWYIFKVDIIHKKLIVNKSFGSFNCDFTHRKAHTVTCMREGRFGGWWEGVIGSCEAYLKCLRLKKIGSTFVPKEVNSEITMAAYIPPLDKVISMVRYLLVLDMNGLYPTCSITT